jgi:NADH:ubiquinone oxidoreductase subunit 6 (subunit J)
MSWKSWVPYHGDHTVRRKLRELDNAGVGVPMFIVLMLQKSMELVLKGIGQDLPIPLWTTFLLVAVLTFVVYVYDKQLKKKAGETAEKAKNKVEE